MEIKITKKPDDSIEKDGKTLPVLRATIGGSPGIGFYLVYRGEAKDVIHMITMVQYELVRQFGAGIVHHTEKEDGEHR